MDPSYRLQASEVTFLSTYVDPHTCDVIFHRQYDMLDDDVFSFNIALEIPSSHSTRILSERLEEYSEIMTMLLDT
ncbi:hypothetical protein TNCV_1399811 [Trichonephila clavipes]|nr:hypothetical protein TNCV_1399811 [Trichonephila clavipes]